MPAAALSKLEAAALTHAICEGIAQGNATLVQIIRDTLSANHSLRNSVESNATKLYDHDAELKLMKGILRSLMGDGDGSSGSVPSLQKEVRDMSRDMSTLTNDMREMKGDIKTILDAQSSQDAQSNRMAGGVAVGRWLIGAAAAVIGGTVTVVVYLFTHGIKP